MRGLIMLPYQLFEANDRPVVVLATKVHKSINTINIMKAPPGGRSSH